MPLEAKAMNSSVSKVPTVQEWRTEFKSSEHTPHIHTYTDVTVTPELAAAETGRSLKISS